MENHVERSLSDLDLLRIVQETVAGGAELEAARVLLYRELGRRGILSGFVEFEE